MPFDGNPNNYETDERTRILRDWVHELRYGGHVQYCGAQRSPDNKRHCAIGVGACFVPGWGAFWVTNLDLWFKRNIGAGVAQRNDGINGHRQHTFSEIADYIEATYL